jgi:hypothetical protein
MHIEAPTWVMLCRITQPAGTELNSLNTWRGKARSRVGVAYAYDFGLRQRTVQNSILLARGTAACRAGPDHADMHA